MVDAPLSRFDPDKLHHRMVKLGERWAELNAAADMLEESRKSVLAELAQQASGGVAERERVALESQTYRDHISAMCEARKQANIARVHYDAAKSWVEMSRSIESTRRAEMQLR
jgi:multidrug resistance efflux pump